MMKNSPLILFVSLITLTSILYAQEAEANKRKDADLIKKLDKDKDGRISIDEAKKDPALSAVFTELDVNKDGFLTAEELIDLEQPEKS